MLKYSVVIPAYKQKELLKNTLESLNNQQDLLEGEYEVIVVDDGSGNDIYSFIKGVNKTYELNYIYLDRSDISCRSRTRNYGWKASKSRFVVFLDQDILVQRSHLKELSRYFKYDSNQMVIGTRFMLPSSIKVVDEIDNESLKKYFYYNQECIEFRHDVFNRFSYNSASFRCPWLIAIGCNTAVPKKWLELVGGFDESIMNWGMEDVELAYRLYKANLKIVFNSKIEGFHQYHNHYERENDDIPEVMYSEVDSNTEYFINKHVDACNDIGVSTSEVYSLFRGKVDYNHNYKKYNTAKIIDFCELSKIDKIKKEILDFSNNLDSEIIVNDYVENSDLDVWIQLLDGNVKNIKYMPFSKKLGKRE